LPGRPATAGLPLLVTGHRRRRLRGRNRLDPSVGANRV